MGKFSGVLKKRSSWLFFGDGEQPNEFLCWEYVEDVWKVPKSATKFWLEVSREPIPESVKVLMLIGCVLADGLCENLFPNLAFWLEDNGCSQANPVWVSLWYE